VPRSAGLQRPHWDARKWSKHENDGRGFCSFGRIRKKLNDEKDEKEKIRVLFDVILGRLPTDEEISSRNESFRTGYKNLASDLFNSEDYRLAFGDFDSVPGNRACDISCEMMDSISEAYCLILKRCPDEESFKSLARRMGFNQATAKTFVQELIKSDEFEKNHMKGKSLEQQISIIYELLLHRTLTQNEILGNMRTLQVHLGGAGYKELADGIMNGAEYSSVFGENKVPVRDFNGPDFNFKNLPPMPFH